MLPKLWAIVVRNVPVIVGEFVKSFKWRAVNTEMDAIARQCSYQFATVTLIYRVFFCNDLIDRVNCQLIISRSMMEFSLVLLDCNQAYRG